MHQLGSASFRGEARNLWRRPAQAVGGEQGLAKVAGWRCAQPASLSYSGGLLAKRRGKGGKHERQ
eukprot:scaffold119612_cov63-Phaeocystis_antarctica.AAC.1